MEVIGIDEISIEIEESLYADVTILPEAIASEFLKISDAESLSKVLTLAAQSHYFNNLPPKSLKLIKKVQARTLNFYAFHKKDRYNEFSIPKRTGGFRVIKAPDKGLKRIQKLLNYCFNLLFIPKAAAHGFISGRSIVTNAKPHAGKRYVYNIDLKDFFPSTHFGRVHAILKLEPFNFSDDVAYLLANLCTDNGSLPQGAPTSPTITNLVCQRLDRRLVNLAKANKCTFTRYADDITFSCNKDIFNESFKTELLATVINEGYAINIKKERLQTFAQRQEVTGVIVNKKTNVSRDYIRKVRAMLHHWKNLGYSRANQIHVGLYDKEKGSLRYNGKTPDLRKVVLGKIHYLGMVRGLEDKMYLDFLQEYNTLNGSIIHHNLQDDIQTLHDIWLLSQVK